MTAPLTAAVLVVDDRTDNLVAMEALLADMPLELVTAGSGRKALEHLLQRDFAVILLDVNMPIMNGFETAELIRKRENSRQTPIIFMTAYSEQVFIKRGYSLGAVDYILQPVVPEILRSKVAVFVDLFLKNGRVVEQARWQRERAQQLQRLASAAVAINSAASMGAALKAITDAARDVIDCHQAITLFHLGPPPAATLDGQAAVAFPHQAFSAYTDKFAEWRARPLRPDLMAASFVESCRTPTRLARHQLSSHPDYPLLIDLEAHRAIPPLMGMLAAPLIGRDQRPMGMIYLSDKIDGEFSAEDEAILLQLSQMAAVAIDNHLNFEAREANRAKDRFLAMLSHDLRTPLTPSLAALSEAVKDERIPSEVRADLAMIRRNVELEARLIDDLLDLTRIASGKLDLRREIIDAHEALHAALGICTLDIDAKALRVTTDLHAADCSVKADRTRLQQIFWNLLKNAVKFTSQGGEIHIESENHADGSLLLRIRDSGIGIDADTLPRIFHAFVQGEAQPARRGLGLGLAISKALVESHGGSIDARSAGRGKGATFTLRLPVERGPAPQPVAQPPHPTAGPARRLRILLVEDHVDTADVLHRLLAKRSHDVLVCRSLTEALDTADRELFDLVISDIGLPDGSGLELLPRLREKRPVVGIALSGFGMDEDIRRSKDAGFREHFIKPLDFQTLAECIDQISAEHHDNPGNGEGQPIPVKIVSGDIGAPDIRQPVAP